MTYQHCFARVSLVAVRWGSRSALLGLRLALAFGIIEREQYGATVLQLLNVHTRVILWSKRRQTRSSQPFRFARSVEEERVDHHHRER
jgi:hypothetical protein